jgi:hypothetical protein
MKKALIVTFGLLGLFVAILLAAIRLYMLRHGPQYRDVLYGGWFDTLTLILWPSSFYLTVMVGKEPPKVAVVVWSIAVLFNPLIYGFVGWVIWRISKVVNPAQG